MEGRPPNLQAIRRGAYRQRKEWINDNPGLKMIEWLKKGRVMNLELQDIRITIDPDYPDKVEIEMMENGVGVEGGQFDLSGLLQAIRKFYNENY